MPQEENANQKQHKKNSMVDVILTIVQALISTNDAVQIPDLNPTVSTPTLLKGIAEFFTKHPPSHTILKLMHVLDTKVFRLVSGIASITLYLLMYVLCAIVIYYNRKKNRELNNNNNHNNELSISQQILMAIKKLTLRKKISLIIEIILNLTLLTTFIASAIIASVITSVLLNVCGAIIGLILSIKELYHFRKSKRKNKIRIDNLKHKIALAMKEEKLLKYLMHLEHQLQLNALIKDQINELEIILMNSFLKYENKFKRDCPVANEKLSRISELKHEINQHYEMLSQLTIKTQIKFNRHEKNRRVLFLTFSILALLASVSILFGVLLGPVGATLIAAGTLTLLAIGIISIVTGITFAIKAAKHNQQHLAKMAKKPKIKKFSFIDRKPQHSIQVDVLIYGKEKSSAEKVKKGLRLSSIFKRKMESLSSDPLPRMKRSLSVG